MDSQRTNHIIEERYLDIHEAAVLLEVREEELWDLVHQHKIPTHNIAGAFLRFKKDDIEALKIKWRIDRQLFPKKQPASPRGEAAGGTSFVHDSAVQKLGFAEKFRDFWYFNDFYVVCSALIVVLLVFIISSQ